MTDEELGRLANAVIRLDGGTYGHAGATKLGRGVLSLLERVRKAEAAVDEARRAALETASRLAEDVEREEGEQGRTGPASGAGEVKDRIKERIRWMDEGTE